MTIGGSKATGVAVPAGFAAAPRSAAAHEYDLQALLGDDVLVPPRKKAGAPAAGPAQPMFAPLIPFQFALDAESGLDFTGSFLSSAPKAPARPQASASSAASGAMGALEDLDEEMFDESGDEWLDDIGDFDLADLDASESASSAGGTSGTGGAQKRKADGSGAGSKRPRHRPTVLAIRQRQQSQLDKLNARNDELRESISDVTGQLDQVKRLLVQLLKRKASK